MNNDTNLVQSYNKSENDKYQKDGMEPWKLVTLGGAIGVLMGAGSVYTGQMVSKDLESEDKDEGGSEGQATEDNLKIAEVEQDQSFGHAFAEARAEVGPGGVFYWHGGIYGTYYADEWNSMSQAEKNEFARHVQPEIHPNELSTPTDANPNVIVVHHVYHVEDINNHETKIDDVQVVDHHTTENDIQDGDVHIVGFANVQGHLTVGYDINSDEMADVAIIDVDDNLEISNPDIVVDKEGNMATVGEIVDGHDLNMDVMDDSTNITDDSSVDTSYPIYDI